MKECGRQRLCHVLTGCPVFTDETMQANTAPPSSIDPDPAASTARITIHRDSPDDVGFREIFVSMDGERVAILQPNETFTIEVTPGRHRLRAHNTLFWKTRDLALRPGESARFVAINRTGFGTFALMILGASPLYLTFERDSHVQVAESSMIE